MGPAGQDRDRFIPASAGNGLDEHGLPDWPNFDGPPPGATYTLAGRAYPEYFCYGDFPQDRAHHHGEPLPRKVVLRKFDLFGRTR